MLGGALVSGLAGAGFLGVEPRAPRTQALPTNSVAVAEIVEPVGPPTAPADEFSNLPPIPENRPRNALYIVISREHNRLWLLEDRRILQAAVCATGKGDTLVWEKTGRRWVFATPAGEFSVQYKTSNPRWLPPEWEYVERGEEPPDWLTRARQARYDMLGDYAINFGDDYNIHGTLYEGLLGRNITHGCVRVGARDLHAIYHRVGKGTRLYIY